MNFSLKLANIIEKLAFSLWGFTLIDLAALFNFEFLKDVDNHLKTFIAIIGSIYFVIQIVFKTIELNHKRKYNKGIKKLQDEDIILKQKEIDNFDLRRDYFTERKQD